MPRTSTVSCVGCSIQQTANIVAGVEFHLMKKKKRCRMRVEEIRETTGSFEIERYSDGKAGNYINVLKGGRTSNFINTLV